MFLVFIRWNEKVRWVQDFLLSSQGFEGFHTELPPARWRNLVCVRVCMCVWSVCKRLSQCWLVLCYFEWWGWNLITLAQFQGIEMPPGLFQDFIYKRVYKTLRLSSLVVERTKWSGYDWGFPIKAIPGFMLWVANFRFPFYEICVRNQWRT